MEEAKKFLGEMMRNGCSLTPDISDILVKGFSASGLKNVGVKLERDAHTGVTKVVSYNTLGGLCMEEKGIEG